MNMENICETWQASRDLQPTAITRRGGNNSVMNNIPFNKPFIAGKELYYIAQTVTFGSTAGDSFFSRE